MYGYFRLLRSTLFLSGRKVSSSFGGKEMGGIIVGSNLFLMQTIFFSDQVLRNNI